VAAFVKLCKSGGVARGKITAAQCKILETELAKLTGTKPGSTTGPPIVSGEAVTGVLASRATVTFGINPHGLLTTSHLQYGLDAKYAAPGAPAYPQTTPSVAVGGTGSVHTLSQSLAGLVPGAVYHVRVVATNSAGTTVGPDVTFTTASA
jgi:hypothetical protein